MKVIRIQHMIKTDEISQGKSVWIDEGGGCTSTTSDIVGILEGEVDGLLEEACEGVLITCLDLTDAEYTELMEGDEFTGWQEA